MIPQGYPLVIELLDAEGVAFAARAVVGWEADPLQPSTYLPMIISRGAREGQWVKALAHPPRVAAVVPWDGDWRYLSMDPEDIR
jgi:hypothetical protein